jgi:hypothetical protein
VLLIWVAVVFGICYLPKGLLTLEDVFVALLALLGAVADGVCLLVARQFCCTQSCLNKKKQYLTMKSLLSLRVMVPSKSVKKMNLGSLKGNRSALRSVAAILCDVIEWRSITGIEVKLSVRVRLKGKQLKVTVTS